MNIMFIIGITGVLISALLNWSAVIWRVRILEYIFKPLVMVFLIVLLRYIAFRSAHQYLATWVGIALGLSLIGDLFLMLPNPAMFLPGLIAFLLAHFAYIAGFNETFPPGVSWLLWLPILMIWALIMPRMLKRMESTENQAMRLPVVIYGLVLSTMLFSSLTTLFRAGWSWQGSLLASSGGALFFLSDMLLAWDRFVDTRHGFQVAVIITYHLAQMCLVAMVYALGV